MTQPDDSRPRRQDPDDGDPDGSDPAAPGPAGQAPAGPSPADKRSARKGPADPGRAGRRRELLASERDAAALYSLLAKSETGERREILAELADVERRHAAHWEGKLADAGERVPPPGAPSLRTRVLALAARRLSTQAVLPMIERAERSDAGVYDLDPDAAPGMADDERGHARTLAKLGAGGPRLSPTAWVTSSASVPAGDQQGELAWQT